MQVLKKFHEIQEYLIDEPLGEALHWLGVLVTNGAQVPGRCSSRILPWGRRVRRDDEMEQITGGSTDDGTDWDSGTDFEGCGV